MLHRSLLCCQSHYCSVYRSTTKAWWLNRSWACQNKWAEDSKWWGNLYRCALQFLSLLFNSPVLGKTQQPTALCACAHAHMYTPPHTHTKSQICTGIHVQFASLHTDTGLTFFSITRASPLLPKNHQLSTGKHGWKKVKYMKCRPHLAQ